MVAEPNGSWPTGLSSDPPEFPELPPDASWPIVARHYGSVTTHLAATLPKIVQALEFLRDAGHSMAFSLAAIRSKTPSIPPTRAESPSYHDAVEQAKRETEVRVKQEAQRTPGPPTLVDSDVATRIATEVWQVKMAEMREMDRIRANEERLAALDAKEAERKAEALRQENERKEDRRKIRLKFWGAIAASVGTGIVALVWAVATMSARAAKERSLGRMEVIHEMQAKPAAPAPASAAP